MPRNADTPRFIDATPTWEGILPSLLAILEAGGPTGRKAATEELARMAKLADLYVAAQKAKPGEPDAQR